MKTSNVSSCPDGRWHKTKANNCGDVENVGGAILVNTDNIEEICNDESILGMLMKQTLPGMKGPWLKATVKRRVDSRLYKVWINEGAVLRHNRHHLRVTKVMLKKPDPQELEVEMQQPVPRNHAPGPPEQPGPLWPTETRQQQRGTPTEPNYTGRSSCLNTLGITSCAK